MTQGDIHELLESLKRELDRMDDEAASRERIDWLVKDIEAYVDDNRDDIDHASLMDRMRSAVDQFEVEHPATTSVIGRLMMALRDMGI